MQALIAGVVIFAECRELPRLAGEPCRDPALDRTEVYADEDMPRRGAERGTGKLGRDRKRIAPAGKLGVVAGNERVDQISRVFGIVALEIVELGSGGGPTPGAGAVDAPPAADATIRRIGIAQEPLGHPYAGIGAALAQSQQLTHDFVGIVRQR